MSDSTNPALIVYDSRKDSAWRITHPYMFPDPDFGTYRVKIQKLPRYIMNYSVKLVNLGKLFSLKILFLKFS